jgi:hypothetical protein
MKNSMKLFLALVMVAFTANLASAQTGVNYEKTGVKNFRLSGGVTQIPMNVPTVYCTVWNTTDSLIVDGSVVVIDTTATIKRIGVRNFIPGTTARGRCLGLAYGNIPRRTTGVSGRVLITGYHPNALIGASGLAPFNLIKTSCTVTGSLALADTTAGIVGIIAGGNAGTVTGVRYTYQVYIFKPLSTMAGPAL